MSTLTIDSTHPSASINLATLKSVIDKVLEAARRNGYITLAPDEYLLLNEIRFAATDGNPTANTVSSITITY